MTDDMERVLSLVDNTNENIFVTGKAGSGKTTFLKALIRHTRKNCVVTAPTGVAAINAGGVTLHSFFGIPFGPISPHDFLDMKFTRKKIDMIQRIELLIIDEVSMVRPDVLDTVDRRMRYCCETDKPFGGAQVVMFGDPFQLPPVVRREETDALGKFYDGYHFFNARVWRKTWFHVIELSKVFRQSDPVFVSVLNKIRDYNVTSDDLDALGDIRRKDIGSVRDDEGYIHICTHRRDVESINSERLGVATNTYKAVITGQFTESAAPCDTTLKLRVGARVMALCNDTQHGYYNGMLGTVVSLCAKSVTARMDSGAKITFIPHKWSNMQYTLEGKAIVSKEVGSCSQIPLSLAWAVTIHKAQGLTFDKVIVHIARTFCPGQLYVALSRCRTMEGIISDAYITKRMIIPDKELTGFMHCVNVNDGFYGRRPVC